MAAPLPDRWASLHRILAQEVPEVAAGSIELRAAARAPGRRTKLAVATIVPELDPVGACVGLGGRHARAISAALGGERVDIVLWTEIPEQLVKLALAPALVRRVELDLVHQRAVAYVPTEQIQQANGNDGENRTLASELTGWTVEIVAADAA